MIKGEKIYLRGLELGDVDIIFPYWNQQQFMEYSGRFLEESREDLVDYVRSTWKKRKNKLCVTKTYLFKLFKHVNLEKIDNPPEFELTPKPIPIEPPDDFDESQITIGSPLE